MIKQIEVDETEEDSIKTAIAIYEALIQILTKKGCANVKDNSGHNKVAQTLKNEIQDEIDRLKSKLNPNYENENEEEAKEKDKQEEQTIEEKIKDIKEEAIKEQRNTETELKSLEQYYIVNKIERTSMVKINEKQNASDKIEYILKTKDIKKFFKNCKWK